MIAQLPASAEQDIAYVRRSFQPLDRSLRPLVERGILPRPSYVLPDGTAMVPADHAQLLRDAGGDPEAVYANFRARFLFACGDPRELEREHRVWLSGDYGAFLHATTPEAIVARSALINAIEALLADPAPKHGWWRGALRGAVDALDSLERPYTQFDRWRPGTTTRERLIAWPRQRFPDVW